MIQREKLKQTIPICVIMSKLRNIKVVNSRENLGMSKVKKVKIIIMFIIISFILPVLGYHTYCHYMVSKFYKYIDGGNSEEIIDWVKKMPDVNMLDVCIPLGYVRSIFFQGAADRGYPIYYAIWKQADISVIEALLKKGANPNIKAPYDISTSFQYLCSHPSREQDIKVELMVQYGADINSVELYIPAFFQDLNEESKQMIFSSISVLWENGVNDRRYVGTEYEATVLHNASEYLDTEYLSRLYHNEKRKMDYLLNEKDIAGETPIFCAIRANAPDNCEFLISEGADISIRNNEGKTAYDVAVELGYEECIEILESEMRYLK